MNREEALELKRGLETGLEGSQSTLFETLNILKPLGITFSVSRIRELEQRLGCMTLINSYEGGASFKEKDTRGITDTQEETHTYRIITHQGVVYSTEVSIPKVPKTN